jgi:hypothetical protein
LVPNAVLLDERVDAANAAWIAYVDGEGSGLAKGGDRRRKFYDGSG